MTLRHSDARRGIPETAALFVRAEGLPFVDLLYMLRDTCSSEFDFEPVAQRLRVSNGPPLFGQSIRADTLRGECDVDLQRHELRVTTAPADWPYGPAVEDFQIAAPNTRTANVEGGLGFVGGVAVWTIPFTRCDAIAPRPGRTNCEFTYNANSASVAGRILREPCGLPYPLAEVRLVEEFSGGGAAGRVWKTGERGEYRFEGLEPGSRLSLQVAGSTPGLALPVPLAGGRYVVKDLSIAEGC
jgi:hypothetical protein